MEPSPQPIGHDSRPVRLYVVRHGQTDWNLAPARCQGWAEVPLNATGRRQAREEGVRLLDAGVELMIIDYRLPDMTGIELATELRKGGYRGDIILISAHSDMIEPDILSRLSISHFFAKPLDLNALSRSIDYLLSLRTPPEKRA